MSIWQKYLNLSPKTRILIGAGLMGYAALGLLVSDQAEEKLGMIPSEKDKEDLKSWMPKVTVVDRDDKT